MAIGAKKDRKTNKDRLHILREMQKNPYHRFNNAFALMSVIPLLILCYIIVSKLFTVNILAGSIGAFIAFAIFIAVCGYFLTHDIFHEMIAYAARLRQRDELKTKFIASISHELKNPLFVIMGGIENMSGGIYGTINDKQKKMLLLCQDVAHKINKLICTLRDMHRIEAGTMDITRNLCNLFSLVEKQTKEFESMLEQKQIEIRKETFGEDFSLWADENKILQAISDLLSNTIDHTPKGGKINLTVSKENNNLKLEIHSTGPRIPADELESIFDKYKKLDLTQEGFNLGLAITKDIIDMHKGGIWAENHPETGNSFTLVLPRNLRTKKRDRRTQNRF